MRRRQAYAVAQGEPALPPLPPKVLNLKKASKIVDKTRKGVCKKCGTYVGRGVALHERRCEG